MTSSFSPTWNSGFPWQIYKDVFIFHFFFLFFSMKITTDLTLSCQMWVTHRGNIEWEESYTAQINMNYMFNPDSKSGRRSWSCLNILWTTDCIILWLQLCVWFPRAAVWLLLKTVRNAASSLCNFSKWMGLFLLSMRVWRGKCCNICASWQSLVEPGGTEVHTAAFWTSR